MRAIIVLAHDLRPPPRSHGILPARRLLEHQEACQAREGNGYARRGDHGPRHDVWGD